jgi:hypothetical protein
LWILIDRENRYCSNMKTFMRKLHLKYSTLLKRYSNLISSFGIYYSITVARSKLHKSLRVLSLLQIQFSIIFPISFLVQKKKTICQKISKHSNSPIILLCCRDFKNFPFLRNLILWIRRNNKIPAIKFYHNWRNFMCKSWEFFKGI